jgi:hypothetical protein
LTDPGPAVTVMELLIVALRFTVATLEFRWALTLTGIRARTATANARGSPLHPASLFFCPSLRREVKLLFLESRETRPVFTRPLRTPVPKVRTGRPAIFASPAVPLRELTTNWAGKTQSGPARPAGLDSLRLDVERFGRVLAGEANPVESISGKTLSTWLELNVRAPISCLRTIMLLAPNGPPHFKHRPYCRLGA